MLLQSIVRHADQKISVLEFVDADERDVVLNKFNNTAKDWPAPYTHTTIHGLFEYWADTTPNARAISFEVRPYFIQDKTSLARTQTLSVSYSFQKYSCNPFSKLLIRVPFDVLPLN